MEQPPTRAEFNELKQEVQQLREQITEPIKIDHLEIDRGGTQKLLIEANKKLDQIIRTQTDRAGRLDALEHNQQELKSELHTLSNDWLDELQKNFDETTQQIAGVSADTLKIRESQADFRDTLLEVKATMATKKDTEDIKATMATKDDLAALKTEHGALLQEILSRLPPKQP